MRTLYGLQYLRALAATLVLLYHARYLVDLPAIEYIFRNGASGVDIFFVISGAVIAMTAQNLSARTFLWKRLLRIVPLYWLFSLLKLLTVAYFAAGTRTIDLSFAYVIKTFLFIPAYDGDGKIQPLIVAGWTLNCEMYFYAVCCLSLLVARKYFVHLCTAYFMLTTLVGIAVFAGHASRPDLPAIAIYLWPNCLEFAAGLVLGNLFRTGRLPGDTRIGGALVLLSTATLLLVPYAADWILLRPVYWGIPAAGIVAGALIMERDRAVTRYALPTVIGDSSYALYLAHTAILPILNIVLRHLSLHPLAHFLLLLCACLTASILVHKLIEMPMNSYFKALLTFARIIPPTGSKLRPESVRT